MSHHHQRHHHHQALPGSSSACTTSAQYCWVSYLIAVVCERLSWILTAAGVQSSELAVDIYFEWGVFGWTIRVDDRGDRYHTSYVQSHGITNNMLFRPISSFRKNIMMIELEDTEQRVKFLSALKVNHTYGDTLLQSTGR